MQCDWLIPIIHASAVEGIYIYTSNGTSAITSSIHFAKDSSINEGAGRTNTQYQSLPFTSSTLMINSIYIYIIFIDLTIQSFHLSWL